MEYLDNVAPEDIPEEALSMRSRPLAGWSGLVQRIIADAQAGRVTVIKVKDDVEYRKMRNGTQNYLRKAKYSIDTRILKQSDGLLVYIQAEPEAQPLEITRTRPPADSPVRRAPVGNRNSHR